MKNNYKELIKQTYNFPQEGFDLQKGRLHFNDIDLKKILDNYGTPLRISYLPKIGSKSEKLGTYLINLLRNMIMQVHMNFVTVPNAVTLVMSLKLHLKKAFHWKPLLLMILILF